MKKLVLLLSFIICSCVENNKTEIKTEITKVDSNQNNIKSNDFRQYWKEFSDVVKKNDTNKMKLFINIPLTILGMEDTDPQFFLKDNEIIKTFNYLLDNSGYYDYKKDFSYSNRELLMSNLDSVNGFKQSSDVQRIEDLVFTKTKEGWKLEIIYMNTTNLKKLNFGNAIKTK